MVYYRVKPEADQKPKIRRLRYKKVQDGVFVANELLTCGELERYDIPYDKVYDIVERVVIPKNKVYWFFGCRFEEGTNWNGKQK